MTRASLVSTLFVLTVGSAAGQDPDARSLRPGESTPLVAVGERTLVSGDLPDVSHAEPHLAIDPTDPMHLLAAAIVLPDSLPHRVDPFVSFDGGRTWARGALPGSEGTETADPWVAFGPDGMPILTVLVDDHERSNANGFSPAGIAVFRSKDGGRTWEGPAIASYGLGASYDAPKVGVDLSRGPYRGRVYIAASHWGPRTRPGDRPTASVGVLSSHNARTFGGPFEIGPNNVNKTSVRPVILADGTLVMLYREWGLIPGYERTDLLWAIHSIDGGATYSPPFLVSAWTSPGFADAAADTAGPWKDRVYAAWLEDATRTEARASAAEFRRDAARWLRVAHSDERGMAWSTPIDVTGSEDGTFLIIHRIAVDGRGNVAVAWVEDRPTDGGQCHDWRVSVSTDGGETFSSPTPVAEPACHDLPGDAIMYTMGHELQPTLPRFGRGGDYFGLVGLPDGGFRLLWSAAEDGVLRLWTAPMSMIR